MSSTAEVGGSPGDPIWADEEEVRHVLEALPEFVSRYLELVADADDHPGGYQTFTELADYVSELAGAIATFGPVLQRCFDAVELVAGTSDDAEELVGWSFLDSLSLDTRQGLLPWFGPRTLAILERVENPDSDDPALSDEDEEDDE
jgi:hypothetical protein